MKFKIAAIGALALTLTGCVTPESSEALKVTSAINKVGMVSNKTQDVLNITAKATIDNMIAVGNAKKINNAFIKLKSHVGRTWYVFSGATPSGWDCSGLTMWFYKQLNINIEHRASRQENAGQIVKSPKLGDIVVFKYRGRSDAYHVGIYAGGGEMIHAPKHGHLTRFENILTFAGNYSDVFYVRILETA